MQKGSIYRGSRRGRDEAFHYIVYLSPLDEASFIGAVLTHSSKRGNRAMEAAHFKETDENGVQYEFKFDDTHVVPCRFIKPEAWGPFSKIGELTDAGTRYVESLVLGEEPISWDEYVSNNQ